MTGEDMTIVPTRTGAALAVSALLLAGCEAAEQPRPAPSTAPSTAAGSTPSTAAAPAVSEEQQALAAARTALQEARSYVFHGSRRMGAIKVTADFRMVGGNTTGTLQMQGRTTKFRTIGKALYLRPSKDFWPVMIGFERAAAAEREAAGRWVRMSDYDSTVSRGFGVPVLLADLRPAGPLVRGRISGTGDDSWVNLTSGTDRKWRVGILTTGKRYPRFWATANSNATITEFDTAFPAIKPPAKADVVTFDELSS
ncbi:hypothetical protein [Actinoplanes sichuanensis]|uniref:Lipoprotein n=1 Tax=Actinoplanes sichuanensis TaxID=512349 RepID=A0ABW3ZZG6_9ACTN|nr:hypothetical protein [Actinoplanes sichuanensis]